MSNIKISVIIPIYNTEKYLEETLDSILNQTMIDDIEVLMIDDESSDNSRYIIEKYALDYDNFYSFHNKNIGSGCERNFGIKHAKGEYIHFMDADDYIIPTFYEKLYKIAKSDDYDFVLGNASKYTKNSTWTEPLFQKIFKEIPDIITSTNIIETPSLIYNATCWDKIIKREFIIMNEIYFPNMKVITQDIPFSIKLHDLTTSIGILNEDIYYWRERKDFSSITQQKNNINSFKDRITVLDIMNSYMEDNNTEDVVKEAGYFKMLDHDLLMYLKRINNYTPQEQKYIIEEVNRILNIIPNNVRCKLNSFKQIMYKMIENRDLESLLEFAKYEGKLKAEPNTANNLDDEYKELIDFKRDAKDEELVANLDDAEIENNNLNLYIDTYIPYLTNEEDDEVNFELLNNKNEIIDYKLKYEIDDDNRNIYKITIPFEEIKSLKGMYSISVRHKKEDIEKNTSLKLKKPKKILNINDVEIILRFGKYRVFNLDIKENTSEKIKLSEINTKKTDKYGKIPSHDKEFNIIFETKEKIDSITLENFVTLERKEYEVNQVSDENKRGQFLDDDENQNLNGGENNQPPIDNDTSKFEVNIPFKDILTSPIRKWEIKTDSKTNFKIDDTFKYIDDKIKIDVKNYGTRVVIIAEYYNKLDEINRLNNDIKKEKDEKNSLSNENKELEKKNKELNNRIEEFKARKTIRIVDGIKRLLKLENK